MAPSRSSSLLQPKKLEYVLRMQEYVVVFCLFSVAWGKKKMRPWKTSSYTALPAKACAIH